MLTMQTNTDKHTQNFKARFLINLYNFQKHTVLTVIFHVNTSYHVTAYISFSDCSFAIIRKLSVHF